MKLKLLTVSKSDEWQAAITSYKHAVMHTCQYNTSLSHLLNQRAYLLVCEGAGFQAVCPLFEREYLGAKDLYSPYGNSGGLIYNGVFDADFTLALKSFLNDKNFVTAYLNLNYSFQAPLLNTNVATNNKKMFLLDLSPELEAIFRKLGRNNRRLIRRWQEQDKKIVVEQETLRNHFLNLYPDYCDLINASKLYQKVGALIEDTSLPTYFIGVKNNYNVVESVRVYFYTEHIVDAFLEANLPGVHDNSRIMYWEAIKYFHQQKIPCMNLGAGITEGDSLERFKASLATRYCYQQNIKLVVNEQRYASLLETKGIKHDTQFFPGYHELV